MMIDGGDRPSSSSLSVSVPSADAMLVEFPGYVRDVRAAMEVLGGEQALAAAAEGRAKYLKARLRPGDPLSHPLVSSAVQEGAEGAAGGGGGRRGLLLRVSREERGAGARGAAATTTTVAAVVSSGVSFPGLADVQYVGWDARAPRSQAGRSSNLAAAAGGGGGGSFGGRGGAGNAFSSPSSSVLPGEPLLAVPPVFFASDVAPAPPVAVPVSAPGPTTRKAK